MCFKSFVLGAVASFVLACTLGAVMVDNAEERYLKACQAIQGEADFGRMNVNNPRYDLQAANRRIAYWLTQLEAYKP